MKIENSECERKVKGLFGFWCFYHSSLENGGTHGDAACLDLFSSFVSITQFSHFLSNELTKLKTSFWCFWVMETELWWNFCKYTHIWGTHGQSIVTSRRYFSQPHQRLLQHHNSFTVHTTNPNHTKTKHIQPHTSSHTPSAQPHLLSPTSANTRCPELRPFFTIPLHW